MTKKKMTHTLNLTSAIRFSSSSHQMQTTSFHSVLIVYTYFTSQHTQVVKIKASLQLTRTRHFLCGFSEMRIGQITEIRRPPARPRPSVLRLSPDNDSAASVPSEISHSYYIPNEVMWVASLGSLPSPKCTRNMVRLNVNLCTLSPSPFVQTAKFKFS